MADHPIETLMKTAMESIKDMIDVNTIVGDPVETPDGSVIMPVSRVSCGFAAGGADYHPNGEGGTARENCLLAEEAVEVYQFDRLVFLL